MLTTQKYSVYNYLSSINQLSFSMENIVFQLTEVKTGYL